MKRLFDFVIALIGIILCLPFFAIVAVLIKFDSEGPVFFTQKRIGKDFRPFRIYKFRTMYSDAGNRGPRITVSGDSRVTRIGKLLRRHKIDELPQLFNVLKGEMSFVGPRPEVGEYVHLFKSDYKKLLKIRPGITDPASIEYAEEERILSHANDWEEEYRKRILPNKIRLSLEYLENRSFMNDLRLIFKTLLKT
jgi:lipopolysaccharide/colanic/teichoic acid biosynthesis glycosyltransferase